MRFRCLECGSGYDQHYPFCARCWRSGSIVPWASRPRAAVDYKPGYATARDIARMAWRTVDQGAYPELALGAGALVLISGPPGSGKSTMAARLLDAVKGPVLLVASEEGISPSLSARLLRVGVKRETFHVLTRATVDAVVGFAAEREVVALAVDSVTEAAWSASELRHVLEVVPSLDLLIGVLQVTKDGLPAGAMQLQHESDVHVAVEGLRWSTIKSRYGAAGIGGEVLQARKEALAC